MKKVVNALTMSRLLATIILPFLWWILSPSILLVFVVLIMLTDFFDCLLARTFKVQSLFGTIMDSVADKTFGIVIIIILCTYNPFYLIPLILEIGISLINIYGSIFGATTKSSFLGKTKMWFLGISIFFGIVSIYSSEVTTFLPTFIKNLIEIFMAHINDLIFASVFVTSGTEILSLKSPWVLQFLPEECLITGRRMR